MPSFSAIVEQTPKMDFSTIDCNENIRKFND